MIRRVQREYRMLIERSINGVTLVPNADLSRMTTMKTRARAALLADVQDPRGLRELLVMSADRGIPLLMLGGGANMLFATSMFNGIVVRLGAPYSGVVPIGNHMVRVGAATPLPSLLSSVRNAGLMGLEFLTMVPGKVGGALAGNAGAGNWGICDFVEQVVCMTRRGRIVKFGRGEFDYWYRHSALRHDIILEADLRLRPLDPAESERLQNDYKSKKKGQPYHMPSSGCIFKNPIDPATKARTSAGKMIDECGLKKYAIRDAEVSEGHANFIVNKGAASGEDFLALITFVQDIVRERRGAELELEVNVVGGPLATADVGVA